MGLRLSPGLLLSCLQLFGVSACGATASMNPPTIVVTSFRGGEAPGARRPMSRDEVLGPRESVYLDIRVDQPAYVAALLYAQAGNSELLNDGARESRLDPGQILRVTVPRRAPASVPEQELWVFVYASRTPIAPALSSVLRLPCPLNFNGKRGDPAGSSSPVTNPPEKSPPPPAEKNEPEKKSESGSEGPPQGPPRGQGSSDTQCIVNSGLSSPLTLQALILRSQ